MADIFDEVAEEQAPVRDIFDEVAEEQAPVRDIFDEVAEEQPRKLSDLEEHKVIKDVLMGEVQALASNPSTLAAIRQGEKQQALVNRERDVAGLMIDLRNEGLNPTFLGRRGTNPAFDRKMMFPGTSKPLTPEQTEKLSRLETLYRQLPSTQETEASLLNEVPSGPSPIAKFFGPALMAQADKEMTQGGIDTSGSATVGALAARMLMGVARGPMGVILPVAGALIGSMAGGQIQEGIRSDLEGNDQVTAARRQRQAEMAQDPNYKMGSIATMGALFRPSLTVMREAVKGNPAALSNIGLGGALGAGTAAVHPILEGRMPTLGEIGEGAALGLAFHQPTRLAQGIFGFHPIELRPNAATDTVRTPIGTLDNVGRIVEPATSEGVALRSVAGLDATTPTEVRSPSPEAEALLDVIAARHTTPEKGTDWPAVRDVLERMQPTQSTDPEFIGVMDDALRMATERAPMGSSLPPEYAKTMELPPRQAARELNIPETEVMRRRELIKEVNDPKYQTDELPESVVRKLKALDRPEGGALGSGGGTSNKPKPIGTPPSGSTDWLEIAPWWKRGGVSFAREGASPILQTRQKNPIGKALGKAHDKQIDVEADLYGRMFKDLERGTQGMNRKQLERAMERLSLYLREKENGRPTPPLTADAQRLLNSWQDVAEFTGLLAQAKNVKVADAGGYRPIRLIGREYLPRMINNDVMRAIRDPKAHPVLFNKLVGELAAQRSITPDEAAAFLNGMAGGKSRTGTNDFMGNIEVARQERLPESFYEYDLRKIIPHYLNRYSKRMGQIIAYGQRLGPEDKPTQKNLWDYAMDEVRGGDTITARWLNEAEAQSRNERVLTGANKFGQRAQTTMTGLLLGDPTSTVPRNLISGLQTTAELTGYWRTAAAAVKALKAANRVPAKELGIIKQDMASMLHAEQLPGESFLDDVIRSVTDKFLKYSGHDASEQFVRATNTLAAASYARDAAAAITNKPNSAFAKKAQGLIRRMGADPMKLAAEGGNWQTGTETQRFIRQLVNQSQGGYKFNQVPLWAGTPAGRFFVPFIRWGTQRAQNLWNNVFKPAFIGDTLKVGGSVMQQRDFAPLARMGLGMVLMGESFAALGKLFFDRDRKDYSFTEIGSKMSEDKMAAAKMLASRIINDIIMGGSLGIWGQPIDLAMAAKDGSRLKNPAEPPAMGPAKAIMQFGMDVWDQRTVTGDDVKRLAQALVRGPVAVVDTTRNWTGKIAGHENPISRFFETQKYEAENDARTLRNAAIRYGQQIGADVAPSGRESSRKTERSPVYTGIRDALLTGDVTSATALKDDYLKSLKEPDRLEAIREIKKSVRARQPFRMGSFYSEDEKGDFMAWARKNLSAQDVDQIVRTQTRYERAAKQLGLW